MAKWSFMDKLLTASDDQTSSDVGGPAPIDEQTGLMTRDGIKACLEAELTELNGENVFAAVVGIDRFETTRAMVGYEAMTEIIQEMARKVSSHQHVKHVARIAPDVIGFFFSGVGSPEANKTFSHLHQDLERFTNVTGGSVSVHVKIGFTLGGPSSNAETLLQRAELALDQARNKWRRTWMFSQSEYGAPEKTLHLMDQLRSGLKNNQFSLHYQPQVHVNSGKVRSLEALLRWTGPSAVDVSIGELIALAENTGDIEAITKWTIDRASQDLDMLIAAGHEVRICLNMSGALICNEDFIDRLIDQLRTQSCFFLIEITETAVLQKPDLALENLRRLAEHGFCISMDDYGTGYSSLSQLQNLPITEIKIDQGFISNLKTSNRNPLIVRSTIELAHALEMEVVAEGVEDAATYALLKAMGCDILQGFFIAKALPMEELIAFLNDGDAISAKNDGPLLDILKLAQK